LYLRRLELRGFKSFADKTSLELEPGIIALVGPNGSGKSNLADAALWALGEQNPRVLRGDSMGDIIFGGSDSQTPLGLAEVSLTLDNTKGLIPFDFSEVTITRRALPSGESDYFLNGARCRLFDIQEVLSRFGLGKEMVTVISQGRLEEVLNGHSEGRKSIIERATGIFRYKWRKEKALKKLISIEEKIVRAQDVLREISRTLTPLKRQAAKCERHHRLSSELKEAKVALAVMELKSYKRRWESGNDKKQEQQVKAAAIKENLAKCAQEIQALQEKLEERFSGKDIENKHHLRTLRTEYERCHSLLFEKEKYLSDRLEDVSGRTRNLHLTAQNEEKRVSRIEEEKRSFNNQLQQVYRELRDTEEKAKVFEKKRAELENGLENKRERLKEYLSEAKIPSISSSKKILGDLIEIVPPFERAILSILGKDRFALVVRDSEEINSILSTLKKNKLKTAFFPLKNYKITNTKITPPPGAVMASEAVKVDAAHKPVIEALLEGVLIIDNLEIAQRLKEKFPRFTYVTLEGVVVYPSGKVAADFRDTKHLSSSQQKLLAQELEAEEQEARAYLEQETTARKAVSKLQLKLASLKERETYLERDYTRAKESLHELKEAEQKAGKRVLDLEGHKKQAQIIKQIFEELLPAISRLQSKFKAVLADKENQFERAKKDLKEKQALTSKLNEEVGQTERELYETSLSLAELEGKVKALVEKIVEDYCVPLERAIENSSDSSNREEVKHGIETLSEQIAAIGPVNPLAIEEAKVLEKRGQFFSKQIEDLLSSRKALDTIVQAVDKKIEQRFFEAFEKVSYNFKSLFQELFPGGKAELSLTPIESGEGIEILAQPPGKSFRKLSLLSGGEKALLALTFLFAVYLANPAPFYVLDEVEPALDEINLQRFLSLMERLKKEAQFLIITHQRRTMEIADSLWGVTLNGDGISKTFSLKTDILETNDRDSEFVYRNSELEI